MSSRGHGIIINLSSFIPFVFEFNPVEIDSRKKINYVSAPNIGGSHKKRYFIGFDSKEVDFKLMVLDKEGPLGVLPQVSYFEQLREPDYGILGFAGSFGNENYPPPQILFQFGTSLVPLVWDVLDVDIKVDHFWDGHISGLIGIPKKAEIGLKLGLVEDNVLNKVQKIAMKVEAIYGSVESIVREVLHKGAGSFSDSKHIRKEALYRNRKSNGIAGGYY